MKLFKHQKKKQTLLSEKKKPGKKNKPVLTRTTTLLFILLWIASVILLYGGRQASRYSNLAIGQKSPETVIAGVDFQCRDIARTELTKRQAGAAVLPVFTINYTPYNNASRQLDKLFSRITHYRQQAATESNSPPVSLMISDVIDLLGLNISAEEALILAPTDQEDETLQLIKDSLRSTWSKGIASNTEKETNFQGAAPAGRISLRDIENDTSITVNVENLQIPGKAIQNTLAKMAGNAKITDQQNEALTRFLKSWVTPNLLFDTRTTSELRKQAENAVQPLIRTVRTGSTIVEDRERITPQIVEMLRAHDRRMNELESPQDRMLKTAGTASLLLTVLIAIITLFHLLTPYVLRSSNLTSLIVVLSLASLFASKGLLYISDKILLLPPWLVEYLIPLSMGPLLATILLGSSAAIITGIWISFVTAMIFDQSFSAFIFGVVITITAAVSARDVRKRANVIRAGFSIGLVKILLALSLAALHQQALSVISSQVITGLLSGLVSALIVTLLIPLFETVFKITTNITLLELSDMGHVLLQRLAMEAPGTYHHSLMVANLAQTAATRVGANALMVRVCAYYHDIGKLSKPGFFSENILLRENPHDHLTPSMSTLVILSHIKEGVGLARKYKLPKPIENGIRQHHGTSLISYFYQLGQTATETTPAGRNRSGRKKQTNRNRC